jgi:hypothetical protein
MRFTLVLLLFAAALSKTAPIEFSGTFYQGSIPGCCFHGISLTGTDGFALSSALPDYASNLGTCSVPCNASGTFTVLTAPGTGWNTSLAGSTIGDPLHYPPGSVGGTINYDVPDVSPPCSVAAECTVVLPVTYSGEVWARFPDSSYLYDLGVSGSGTLNTYLMPLSNSSTLIFGVSATITGTASPVPEPGTIGLLMSGALVLIARKFRRAFSQIAQ